MKRNEGFTLVELLVTLTAGALVTFAAVSLLLLGMRVQHGSSTDVKEQQTVRVVLSLLEEMATSGEINTIKPTYDGWQLLDAKGTTDTTDDVVLFEYVATEQTVYTGAAATGAPLLTGLNNAGVTMEGKLMRLSFDTDRGESYVTRVYCRTKVDDELLLTDSEVDSIISDNEPSLNTDDRGLRRLAFLEVLAGEYGSGNNTGAIQNPITPEGGTPQTYKYYSEWYIGGYAGNPGWNKDTPWCACYASWAAVKCGVLPADSVFRFANVDTGMAAFKNPVNGGEWKEGSATPTPGDYIFFDWSGERKDPAHVGVVLDVDTAGGYVYTIEGNSSNRVAVRKYPLNAEDIMGYGVLPQFNIPESTA